MRTPPALLCVLSTLALAAPALAQFKLDADAPPPLKGPSPLIHYTVENPYPLAILLIAIALIAYFYLSSRGDPKQARRAALAPALAAVAVVASALAITTKREKVTQVTKQFITDVAAANIDAVDQTTTPGAKLFLPANPAGMDKARILNRVTAMLGPNGATRIEEHALLDAQVEPTPTGTVYVQVKVRVTPQGSGPVISWWRLDAVPAGNSYQFSGIKYLSSNFPIPF